ncbi:hypothetical protein [Streptomyces sp. ST1020]|uniref:hypothetical protein n=1 Tax=Streptomyces sp. ST1020 TaxID=1848901 RepID=UPI0034C690B1
MSSARYAAPGPSACQLGSYRATTFSRTTAVVPDASPVALVYPNPTLRPRYGPKSVPWARAGSTTSPGARAPGSVPATTGRSSPGVSVWLARSYVPSSPAYKVAG